MLLSFASHALLKIVEMLSSLYQEGKKQTHKENAANAAFSLFIWPETETIQLLSVANLLAYNL